jgi:hypothetical protein
MGDLSTKQTSKISQNCSINNNAIHNKNDYQSNHIGQHNIQITATNDNNSKNNNSKYATLDCGAKTTLMNKELANELKIEIEEVKSNTIWTTANNTALDIIGEAACTIQFGKTEIKHTIKIASNLSHQFIIGTDVIRTYKFKLDFEENVCELNGERISIDSISSFSDDIDERSNTQTNKADA